MRMARWTLLVALFVFISPLRADDWPIARGKSREPLPYRYDPSVLKTTPKSFLDDASACILYAATTHLIEPDGTVESISHEVTRLNSRRGIERLGEYRSIAFDPDFEKLTLNEARVIKADGKIVPIEPKHVQLRDVATDYQVYDQQKQVIISFPNLEVGDVYEVKWTIRGRNREFDGDFFARYSFGDDQYPVARDEFRVRVPKNKTLKHATVNGNVNLIVTDVGGEKLYHWSVLNRAELPKDDDRPSREELRLQVMISTFPTWDAIGEWKQKRRKDCWECTAEIRKIVEEVTRDKSTQVEKAKALTYWVRRHVRYLSRGPGGLGYTPHLPHQVLNQLFGDCKDQSQLLAVMLREIGLPVWLVTLGARDDGQIVTDVPSPWGTHAILLTQIDGKDYWIDTTISMAAWDFLPRSDRDRHVYVTKEAELKLLKTPAFTHKDYRIEQTTHVTVLPDGTSRFKRESTYHHSAAWSRRDRLLDVAPGERRRFITAELQDADSKSKLLSFKVDQNQLLDFDRPVQTEMEFEIPKHFSSEGLTREASFTDSPVWTWFLGYTLDPDRRLPFVLPTQLETTHRFVVTLPPTFRLESVPTNRRHETPWGLFAVKVKQDTKEPRRLEFETHFRLEKVKFEKSEFADFHAFQDQVRRFYRVWLNLIPTTDIADAPLMEKYLKEQKNGDAHAAKILAKLYIDNDRAEDAERVLGEAVKHMADDTAIWELRVKASPNVEAEERLYRDMVKQFPDDPKYAVALGAACVRRESHADAEKILTPLTKHELAPVRAAAQYQLARSAYRQKKYDQAQKHIQQALLTDSNSLASMDALHFKARVHEKLGQLKEAIGTLSAAIDADPNARDALEYLVRLELQAGLRDAALDHLRRYTVAAGKDLSSLVKAADLHLELDRYEDALELANRARDIGFQAKAQRILGLVYLAKHDYQRAAFHLDRCDLDAKGLIGLIQAHLRLGDLDAAKRRLETMRKVEASDELLAMAKDVTALLARRDKLLEEWNAPKEQQSAANRVVGRFLCIERGLAEAWPRPHLEAVMNEATKEGLEFAPLLGVRALFALERGQLRNAIADADRAIKRQPTESRALFVRGRARIEQGNVPAALSDLRKATDLSGGQDPVILHWFAAALLESGRVKEAIQTQRLALLLRPNDVEMQQQLQRMEKHQSKESGGEMR